MYEFVALSLKCRICGESLMDKKNWLTMNPVLSLNVKYGDKEES